MNKPSAEAKKRFKNFSILQNPVLVEGIGLAPVLAAARSAKAGVLLSVITAAALFITELLTNRLLKKLSTPVRMLCYFIVGSAVTLCAMAVTDRFFSGLSVELGLFLPLTAVNSFVALHCERYASTDTPLKTVMLRSGASALGYAGVTMLVSVLREFFAKGSIFDAKLFERGTSPGYELPFFALAVLGFSFAVLKTVCGNDFNNENADKAFMEHSIFTDRNTLSEENNMKRKGNDVASLSEEQKRELKKAEREEEILAEQERAQRLDDEILIRELREKKRLEEEQRISEAKERKRMEKEEKSRGIAARREEKRKKKEEEERLKKAEAERKQQELEAEVKRQAELREKKRLEREAALAARKAEAEAKISAAPVIGVQPTESAPEAAERIYEPAEVMQTEKVIQPEEIIQTAPAVIPEMLTVKEEVKTRGIAARREEKRKKKEEEERLRKAEEERKRLELEAAVKRQAELREKKRLEREAALAARKAEAEAKISTVSVLNTKPTESASDEAERIYEAEKAKRIEAFEAQKKLAAEEEARRAAAYEAQRRSAEEAAKRTAQPAGNAAPAFSAADIDAMPEGYRHFDSVEEEIKRRVEAEVQKRLAAEAELKRITELQEQRRLAVEAEERLKAELELHRKAEREIQEAKRLAELQEQKRLAAAEEARRQAELMEQRRLAAEAEAKRKAEIEEQKRLAAEAEAIRKAELEEQRRREREEAARKAAEERERRIREKVENAQLELDRRAEEAEQRLGGTVRTESSLDRKEKARLKAEEERQKYEALKREEEQKQLEAKKAEAEKRLNKLAQNGEQISAVRSRSDDRLRQKALAKEEKRRAKLAKKGKLPEFTQQEAPAAPLVIPDISVNSAVRPEKNAPGENPLLMPLSDDD